MPPQGDLQLSIGYWLVSHKATLRKWWAISLLSFIGLSFLGGAVFTIIFYSQSGTVDRQLASRAQAIGQWTAAALQTPKDVRVSTATVIARDNRHVDLVATVTNPNASWGATTLKVHFSVDGKPTSTQTLFVNPSDERPVIQPNVRVTDSQSAQAELVVESTAWTKTNASSLPAANFATDSLTLTPTTVSVNGQSVATVTVRAGLTNRSVYNFRRVVVPIELFNGSTIVAVDQISTDAWPTLTSKTITTTWSYPVSGELTARLFPQVSRFDQDNVYR